MTGANGRAEKLRARQEEAHRQHALRREVEARARACLPMRATPPEHVVLRLGPTNSGKTHDGLEFLLAQAGQGLRGTYAAPLRMLARQAYERLRERVRPERLGLVTGEERINPEADILCCTAESARTSGDVLVLDEAHWLADPERGPAWTRLLLSGSHRYVQITAAPEAAPLLGAAFAQARRLDVVRHHRSAELTSAPAMGPTGLPAGSAVIAFSRKAVLTLHREIIDHGRTATVLYGAMPPAARREQIRRLVAGEVEVIVTTDVIGHGVNLPLRAVAFAETGKFDGGRRRPLRLWEAAQIAGRAGRRGHGAGDGLVAVYRSGVSGFSPDADLVRAAVHVANGAPSDLLLARARLRPAWHDLGDPRPGEIPHALNGWYQAARDERPLHSWLDPAPVDSLLEMWQVARASVGVRGAVDAAWPGDGLTVWRLMNLPLDPGGAFGRIASAVLNGGSLRTLTLPEPAVSRLDLEDAERYAATMRDLRTAAQSFGAIGGVDPAETAAGEEAASARIVDLVAGRGPLVKAPACLSCGASCAPWFERCDGCHGGRAVRRRAVSLRDAGRGAVRGSSEGD